MNEPKLRFKADGEIPFPDWEKKELSDICELITVGIANSATQAYRDTGVIMFRNQNIKENYLDTSDLIYIDPEFEKKYKKKRLKADDLLIVRTGYPGTACLVPPEYEDAQTFTTLIARLIKNENVPAYVCQYINSPLGKSYFESTQIGGGQKNSGAKILENFPISLPSLPEQQKIAFLFTELDTIIQSAEKELEGYRELKQGMLQKMFPKKGETVPEIRFPEFTGDWEQRQVSEMFKITRGYVLPVTETSKETSIEMPYPVYSSQTKDNGLMGYYGNYLYEDAITWTTDGANAGTVNYRAGKFYCTNVCGVLLSDKMEASKAIAEALNIVAKKYVSYVGNPKLMNNVMAEIQIAVPPTKEERNKISSYFKELDNLIALQQKEIDGYKGLKKGLLQQMFC